MLAFLQSSELPGMPRAAGRMWEGGSVCSKEMPALRQAAEKLNPTEGAQMATAVANGSHLTLGRWHCIISRWEPTAHLPREIFFWMKAVGKAWTVLLEEQSEWWHPQTDAFPQHHCAK